MKYIGTSPSTLLADQMRAATWHRHKDLEQLLFVKALMDGSLPMDSYIVQLRGFSVIFSALELTLALSESPVIAMLRPLVKSRFDMLCADLAFLSTRLVPDIIPAVSHALVIAEKIRASSFSSDGTLFGYLYVLVGTTKGNLVHYPDIVSCFNLKENKGASFYRGYGDATDSHWEEFCTIINSAEENVTHDALQGAAVMYDDMESFHRSLYPISEMDRIYTATSLNPEAGNHPVPQDQEILHAAIKAGRRCHDEFCYYELRYGERGRRFTDSDAAWLAYLTDQPASVVAGQVLWLGRILSFRGMPFLLLERQLDYLVDELEVLVNSASTEVLKAVVSSMRQKRNRLIPQRRFDEICGALSEIITLPAAIDFPDLPLILVSAQVDALAGMPECLASITSWLQELSLITEEEIETIKNILAATDIVRLEP